MLQNSRGFELFGLNKDQLSLAGYKPLPKKVIVFPLGQSQTDAGVTNFCQEAYYYHHLKNILFSQV